MQATQKADAQAQADEAVSKAEASVTTTEAKIEQYVAQMAEPLQGAAAGRHKSDLQALLVRSCYASGCSSLLLCRMDDPEIVSGDLDAATHCSRDLPLVVLVHILTQGAHCSVASPKWRRHCLRQCGCTSLLRLKFAC